MDLYNAINLYEHQSTQNENMPLRGLLYLAKLFEGYISEHRLDIYGKKVCSLPTPRYIVFYNGKANEPDEKILRLSNTFLKDGGCLECETKLLNVNYGHKRHFCRPSCQRCVGINPFGDSCCKGAAAVVPISIIHN